MQLSVRMDARNLLRNFAVTALLLVSSLAADVWDAPVFKVKPENKVASTGTDVVLTCSLLEEAGLAVNWRRGDGRPLPQGRYKVQADRSLTLLSLEEGDDALYICSASNKYGTSEASAKLTIHAPPRFLTKPRDKWIAVGKTVKLKCTVSGNPQPSLFWSKNELLLFPDQKMGRYSVDKAGNLRIEAAEEFDSGDWVCNVLSTAGSLSVTAKLTVIHQDPNKTCKDWRGRTIFEGDRFYPDEQYLCYRCRCLNATAQHCKTRTCHQPKEDCAVWQKVPAECCRFTCIKKLDDSGATYKTESNQESKKSVKKEDDDNGANAVRINILATILAILLVKIIT